MSQLGSLSPKVWGHAGWKFLFAIASVYSENSASREIRQKYFTLFNVLKDVLPCQNCRQHYAEYIKNKPLPFYLENQGTLFYWLLGLHNKSNSDNMLLTKEAAINYYLKDKQRQQLPNQHVNSNKQKCTNCNEKL